MSETNARLSIGEFSRATWLSAKALRIYERRGLLLPDVVDEYTGYRYYRSSQAQRARLIALLRRAGMPLDRIGTVLDASNAERSALLEEYRIDVARAHARANALLDSLAVGLLDQPSASIGEGPAISTRRVPEQAYLAHGVRTTAGDLPSHIERAVALLTQRARASIDRSRPLVVVYHGEVSWESDGPIEVRVPVHNGAAADGVDPSGTELFTEVPYGEVQFPTIVRAFDAVRAAAHEGGRHPSGSPREIYWEGEPFRCQVAQPYVSAQ
ncbi:MerR family transcriptional regulator [Demequina sp. TTPB684]|uniref:MerR family transcriptional regulator n=1 Tax=unclassified Demequina TaxID=2620311 RepID=UPI001CF4ED44|nr:MULTISPECIES: MerR family transcriptional regulator [unclassified Demequina]MCB2413818.1 MerR family transcriptional regulator [Demequina sp. TTPB684]UPU89131.1 MerR family transcriptional regulator [Demequina sp. TMPB413]